MVVVNVEYSDGANGEVIIGSVEDWHNSIIGENSGTRVPDGMERVIQDLKGSRWKGNTVRYVK
jgi:hypothetical protein